MPRQTKLHWNNVRCERVKRSNTQKLSGPGTITPTLSELQTKLDSVRREVRNLTVMGMDPGQTPEQAALIKQLERSARAEMRLRSMALEYAKGELHSDRHHEVGKAARQLLPGDRCSFIPSLAGAGLKRRWGCQGFQRRPFSP
jgi:hypothetical protein